MGSFFGSSLFRELSKLFGIGGFLVSFLGGRELSKAFGKFVARVFKCFSVLSGKFQVKFGVFSILSVFSLF